MTQRKITVRMADGSSAEAIVEYMENEPTCRLHLAGDGMDETATGPDFFESFSAIRKRLAARGIYPLCYGAAQNVWPSGMARDMGQGLAAYKLRIGSPAEELVHIFASGPDIDPVTPEEQRAFYRAWFKSLR